MEVSEAYVCIRNWVAMEDESEENNVQWGNGK